MSSNAVEIEGDLERAPVPMGNAGQVAILHLVVAGAGKKWPDLEASDAIQAGRAGQAGGAGMAGGAPAEGHDAAGSVGFDSEGTPAALRRPQGAARGGPAGVDPATLTNWPDPATALHLAVREGYGRAVPRVDVVPVRVFGELAWDVLAWDALQPGVRVRAVGKLRDSAFTGRDGQGRSALEFHAFEVAVVIRVPRAGGVGGPQGVLHAFEGAAPG